MKYHAKSIEGIARLVFDEAVDGDMSDNDKFPNAYGIMIDYTIHQYAEKHPETSNNELWELEEYVDDLLSYWITTEL